MLIILATTVIFSFLFADPYESVNLIQEVDDGQLRKTRYWNLLPVAWKTLYRNLCIY